jgi:hypothetical protein
MRMNKDIFDANAGMLPVVVIDKPINDRMASTIRHNRARGKHAVTGMADMVFAMLDGGWDDSAVCNEIGLSPEELVRIKVVTGFAKLFENVEYNRSWTTARMEQLKREQKDGDGGGGTQGSEDPARLAEGRGGAD